MGSGDRRDRGLRSLTLVQRSCQCVDAAAVCVRGQGVLRGHGWDVVGWGRLGGWTWHHIWYTTHTEEIHRVKEVVSMRSRVDKVVFLHKCDHNYCTFCSHFLQQFCFAAIVHTRTQAIFFHQSIFVPLFPVNHLFINEFCEEIKQWIYSWFNVLDTGFENALRCFSSILSQMLL